ncbi:MAG: Cbb3-type cytochrome c oxidase subunit CcoN1 [Chlamydiae bacterium]|nr:Cbb3-type cytochrome c oxidase subunit CcoN1 [Chlamydiota bacterium]
MDAKVVHDDRAVKQMLYPALGFLLVGLFVGVFISYNGFLVPDYFKGEYIHFGRVRPVHVTVVTLLWLLSANMGLMYYFVPRLCGTRLFSPKLATVTSWIWWPALILGAFSFPMGTNFGWEYAELPMTIGGGWFPVKLIVGIAWVLFATNLFLTIFHRRYQKMYVSLWYVMATLIWTSFTYVVGNFVVEWVPMGISRVNTSFFYVHNLVGLIFTPMGLAIAYYFLPKIAGTPIYSHRLSMVGFWSIAFVYAWIGAHHMLHGPQSQWLQTTSIIFSMWLIVPVWTVVMNLLGTVKMRWELYSKSVPLRFLTMGVVFYLIVCLQGSLQSLRNVNEIVSKTDWIIGHAHMSLLGTFTFFVIAGIYYVIPKIAKKPLYSQRLAEWHFTLALTGSVLMFAVLWIGGFKQGLEWANWGTGSSYAQFHENLSRLPFLVTLEKMWGWWLLRMISGVMIFVGCLLFVWNLMNTIILPERVPVEKRVMT